jgi:hypothetical protein
MKKMSSISYDTYLFQVKRVDEMFVIILKMTSLNLFGCKEYCRQRAPIENAWLTSGIF